MISLRQAVGLVISIGVCFGAAAIGSMLTAPSLDGWYAALTKPSYTPPDWLFGPIWSALYLSMAIAAWLVWHAAGFSKAKVALTLFAVQLVLNVCWSAIFFWTHRQGFAFGEIIALWIVILATTVAFRRWSRAAAWLMVPYLLWIAFAATLNYSIWRLNA